MQTKNGQRPSTLIELLVNVIVPGVILMKLSSPEWLGPVNALVLALSFPIVYGGWDLVRNRHLNYIAILGVVSVLLTGGIGLLKLDVKWLAIKEAAVPALIGLVVVVSGFTRSPLVKKLLFNSVLMATDKIQQKMDHANKSDVFERKLRNANHCLAGAFLFSSIMNYVLAKVIVTSQAGTVAFNEELGKMTLLSYPMIVIPCMFIFFGIIWYIVHIIIKLTGLELQDIFVKKDG